MTFNEWRQTRVWRDNLQDRNTEMANEPGFYYADGSTIYNISIFTSLKMWDASYEQHEGMFATLAEAEYFMWDMVAKHNYDTMQDTCTIIWSENVRYSCTAALTRGLSDEDSFDELQELLTLDNDVEKEEVGTDCAVIGEVTWE